MSLANGANDRIKTDQNILDRMDKLERLVEALARRDVSVSTVDELTDNLGDMRAGRFLALSGGSEPTDADGCGVGMDSEGQDFGDGQLYNLYGVYNGLMTFGMRSTDGAGVFAGGAGVIDASGINLNGVRYALQHYATDEAGTNPRKSRVEMFYPDGGTVPALRMLYYDDTSYPELLTNGSFESGTAPWTNSGSVTYLEVSGDHLYGAGTAALRATTAPGSGTVLSSLATVTGGAYYSLEGAVASDINFTSTGSGTHTTTTYLDFYTASTVLVSSVTVNTRSHSYTNSAPRAYTHWKSWDVLARTAQAPTTAGLAQVRVKEVFGRSGTGIGGQLYLDDLSLSQIASQKYLYLDDAGAHYKSGLTTTAGPDQNRNGASTFSAQVGRVQVRETLKLSAFLWDVRNAGTYELHRCYSSTITDSFGTLALATVAAGTAEVTFTLGTPLVLGPGSYYFGLKKQGAAATWQDYNAGSWACGDFVWDGIWMDGSSYVGSYVPAAKLVYSLGEFV